VFARGNRRQRIYRDRGDLEVYLALLGRAVTSCEWRCLGYCLMPNHVHLLIESVKGNLAVGMQWFHGRYAQWHNKRHGYSGHLFQGRYGAIRVTSDVQLWMAAAYIARNPVDARLCERPEEWMWSRYAAMLGVVPSPSWLDVERLLGYFAAAGGDARRRFADLTISS
jgi:REP element-mobilizing transposase RayT